MDECKALNGGTVCGRAHRCDADSGECVAVSSLESPGDFSMYLRDASHAMFPFGRAVQVDPIKHKLKAPGTNLLTLEYDDLLSTLAFTFNLRHHTSATITAACAPSASAPSTSAAGRGLCNELSTNTQYTYDPRISPPDMCSDTLLGRSIGLRARVV